MANYWQWRSKHPEHKLLYWICGEELALRLEVLDAIKAQWQTSVVDLTYPQATVAEIESAVLTSDTALKMVIIRNADKLPDKWKEKLRNWAIGVYLGDIPQTLLTVYTEEDNPDTTQPVYRPFVEKGRFVECKKLTADGLKRYAMEYGCTEDAADLLNEMISFNFLRLNNELEKLACLGLPSIEVADIKKFVVFTPDDLFVWYLLRRNIDAAMKVVSSVPKTAVLSILTILIKKLSFLYLMIINDAPGMSAHKLAAILGVQPWQLLEFFDIKKYWTAALVKDKLKTIVEIEGNYTVYESNVLPLLASWW